MSAGGVVRSYSLAIEFSLAKTRGEFSGVLGAEPLGEGVASNEVRARGRLSPPLFFICFLAGVSVFGTFSSCKNR